MPAFRGSPSATVATLAALVLVACAPEGPRPLVLEALPSPAGVNAAEPFVAVAPDGRVHLSWLERSPDTTATLYVATLDAATRQWSTPKVVVKRKDLFVNWADFPSVVALADGRLLAHWLQRSGTGRYDYDVVLSESRDGGDTWGPTALPHPSGVGGEHGFVSILPLAGGGAQLSFLDGTAGKLAKQGESKAMQLGWASWGEGTVTARAVIDPRVCDCCQTAMAMTTKGPVVVYRDRSEEEIRDMYVLRHVDGAWTTPAPLHDDGWKVDFCPVNGPAIATVGDTAAAAWFTAAQDTARVLVSFSTDAAATFSAPARVDLGTPSGRVDIEMLDAGAALVTWVEKTTGQEAQVLARVVRRDGTIEPHVVVSPTSGARSSGFPRMARTADGVVLAWTIPGTPGTVHVAALRIGAN
jgi:hypothetical protein